MNNNAPFFIHHFWAAHWSSFPLSFYYHLFDHVIHHISQNEPSTIYWNETKTVVEDPCIVCSISSQQHLFHSSKIVESSFSHCNNMIEDLISKGELCSVILGWAVVVVFGLGRVLWSVWIRSQENKEQPNQGIASYHLLDDIPSQE